MTTKIGIVGTGNIGRIVGQTPCISFSIAGLPAVVNLKFGAAMPTRVKSRSSNGHGHPTNRRISRPRKNTNCQTNDIVKKIAMSCGDG